jgi:FRG domain
VKSHTAIENLSSLITAIFDASELFQSVVWWRGQPLMGKLVPRIHRKPDNRLVEQSAILEFRSKARTRHSSCPQEDDLPAWLFLMQHYRLPTRLLDWSESPLVAAYFAVTDMEKKHENESQLQPAESGWLGMATETRLKFTDAEVFIITRRFFTLRCNILFDDLVRHIPRTRRKVAAGPEVPPPKLAIQFAKLL